MRIIVLPGDGIGPEITAATVAVLEATVDELIVTPSTRTPDLGGPLRSAEFASAPCERVGQALGRV